jgi:hypothetical protein
MSEYRVYWSIEVEAPSALLAAIVAEEIQRVQGMNDGGVFTVDTDGGESKVDLATLLIPRKARRALAAGLLEGENIVKAIVEEGDGT